MDRVTTGKFREDLCYQILGFSIELPPLRERENDILILAKYFMAEYASENNAKLVTLNEAATGKLMHYNYPGNVRELNAIVDLACVMSNGVKLEASDIVYPDLKGAQQFIATEKNFRNISGISFNSILRNMIIMLFTWRINSELGKALYII